MASLFCYEGIKLNNKEWFNRILKLIIVIISHQCVHSGL